MLAADQVYRLSGSLKPYQMHSYCTGSRQHHMLLNWHPPNSTFPSGCPGAHSDSSAHSNNKHMFRIIMLLPHAGRV